MHSTIFGKMMQNHHCPTLAFFVDFWQRKGIFPPLRPNSFALTHYFRKYLRIFPYWKFIPCISRSLNSGLNSPLVGWDRGVNPAFPRKIVECVRRNIVWNNSTFQGGSYTWGLYSPIHNNRVEHPLPPTKQAVFPGPQSDHVMMGSWGNYIGTFFCQEVLFSFWPWL